jgi:phosphoenolpyruvate carboxylase
MIVESEILYSLSLQGVIIKKSTLVRTSVIYLLENLRVLENHPEYLQRVYSNASFTNTLGQIQSKIPKHSTVSESAEHKDRIISMSTQIQKKSHALINEIIKKSTILHCLSQKGFHTSKAIIIKASVAYLFENLDVLEKRPEIIYRVLSLDGTHHILEKIHSIVTGDVK